MEPTWAYPLSRTLSVRTSPSKVHQPWSQWPVKPKPGKSRRPIPEVSIKLQKPLLWYSPGPTPKLEPPFQLSQLRGPIWVHPLSHTLSVLSTRRSRIRHRWLQWPAKSTPEKSRRPYSPIIVNQPVWDHSEKTNHSLSITLH